jgi:hypothetical protein
MSNMCPKRIVVFFLQEELQLDSHGSPCIMRKVGIKEEGKYLIYKFVKTNTQPNSYYIKVFNFLFSIGLERV